MSAVPAKPFRPASCSSASASSPLDSRVCSSSQSRTPGSTLPERVAITRPSSGVKPIVVSIDLPSLIAHSEEPAPRWQLTIRKPDGASPSSSGARLATQEWESPWKP